jgi:hypothetical protein
MMFNWHFKLRIGWHADLRGKDGYGRIKSVKIPPYRVNPRAI